MTNTPHPEEETEDLSTFEGYQRAALRTKRPEYDSRKVVDNCIYGLIGELGELSDMLKKSFFHDHPMPSPEALSKEVGDLLWYWAVLCHGLGVDPAEAAARNIAKLKARYPKGFSPQDSMNRVEYKQDGTGKP